MKAALILASVLALGSVQAKADGFICQAPSEDLTVKVFNHVSPELGTRSAAVLVLSNPTISDGNKTIARFTDANATLVSQGAEYTAKVDLRFNDSARKGELIAGTKLGQLQTVVLDVDYNVNQPIAAGDVVDGSLELIKRDGESIRVALDCERYLKN